jgi:hypothetical protein
VRVDVGEGGETGTYAGVEDLFRGLLRHGQYGARSGPGAGIGDLGFRTVQLALPAVHLTLPAVSPDFQ